MKEKLSSIKVAEVLRQVGPTLRALSEENQTLKDKVAHFEKKERVEKIASQMDAKSLDTDSTHEEKVERLMASDKLDVVEEAVGLSAPQIKLAALSDHPGNALDAKTAFENAIMGDD